MLMLTGVELLKWLIKTAITSVPDVKLHTLTTIAVASKVFFN